MTEFKPTAPGPCEFCRIAEGKEPAAVVFEDEISLAFLDVRPVFPGHCLLVPRKHYQALEDLPQKLLGPRNNLPQRLWQILAVV